MDIKKKKNIWQIVVIATIAAGVYTILNLFGDYPAKVIIDILLGADKEGGILYSANEIKELRAINTSPYYQGQIIAYSIYLFIAILLFVINFYVKNIPIRLRIILATIFIVFIEYSFINLLLSLRTQFNFFYVFFRIVVVIIEIYILQLVIRYVYSKLFEKYCNTNILTETE